MKKIFLFFALSCFALQASTSLEIYTNKYFLKQSFPSSKQINLKLPLHVKLQDIRYELPVQCQLEDESISKKQKQEDENFKLYENLLTQKKALNIKIKALQEKEKFFTTLSLKDTQSFDKIKKLAQYLEKNIISIENEIQTVEKKISKIDEKLAVLKPQLKEYKTLHVNFTCKNKKALIFISYPLQNISYEPFYEVYADSKDKKLRLISKSVITQNSLEDLKNIDVNIYSSAYNKNIQPQTFYPRYLQQEVREKTLMKTRMDTMQISKTNMPVRKTLNNIYAYSLKNVTLKLNAQNILTLDNEIIDTKFSYIIDGYGTNKAYIKADFQPQKIYKGSLAKLFFNNLPVAKIYISDLKNDTNNTLYFGENQFINVKKKLIEIENEDTFFSGKTSMQKWQYTLSNKNNFAANIEFITQTPVSKDANIKVKTVANPMFDTQSADGKNTWNFTLKKDEIKTIIFGYSITKSE